MPGNIRLWGTSGYVELAAPEGAANQVLTLPTDSVKPAMVLVASQSFSSVSTINVNNCFTSLYENYKIISDFNQFSSQGFVNIRLRSGGVDASGSNYDRQRNYSGSYTRHNNESSWQWGESGTGDNDTNFGLMTVLRPAVIAPTMMWSEFNYAASGPAFPLQITHASSHQLSNSYDGMTVTISSGTFSGTLRIYGYRNS